jgi:hypothetical protein
MAGDALKNPLGLARLIALLEDELRAFGFAVHFSEDLRQFATLKKELRNQPPHPYHDASVNDVAPGRFYWMHVTDSEGKARGLQAFRIDTVDTNLADWCTTYTIGLYMRRQEILVPAHSAPPRGSLTERLRGRLAYHGELWIDPHVRNRMVMEKFSRLGMLLALVRWNPDAIWALAGQNMATHGHLNRMGYAYLERGFFRWEWISEGIDPVEWIAISERANLEQLVDEMLTTPQQSRLALPH